MALGEVGEQLEGGAGGGLLEADAETEVDGIGEHVVRAAGAPVGSVNRDSTSNSTVTPVARSTMGWTTVGRRVPSGRWTGAPQ